MSVQNLTEIHQIVVKIFYSGQSGLFHHRNNKKKNAVLKHSGAKPTHLVDHLNFSEGQTVQPVNLHHVPLSMGLCQLDGERKQERREEERG